MGADLRRVHPDKDVAYGPYERSEKAVEGGYFRDPYNSTTILNQFELSWWRDIVPLVDSTGVLMPDKVKLFREMIERHQSMFDDNIDKMTPEWQQHYREGADLLIKFLDAAIAAGDSIDASL